MTIAEYKEAKENEVAELKEQLENYELAIRELKRQLAERDSVKNIDWIITTDCKIPDIKVLEGPFCGDIVWKDTLETK